jgi:hypothetical protein
MAYAKNCSRTRAHRDWPNAFLRFKLTCRRRMRIMARPPKMAPTRKRRWKGESQATPYRADSRLNPRGCHQHATSFSEASPRYLSRRSALSAVNSEACRESLPRSWQKYYGQKNCGAYSSALNPRALHLSLRFPNFFAPNLFASYPDVAPGDAHCCSQLGGMSRVPARILAKILWAEKLRRILLNPELVLVGPQHHPQHHIGWNSLTTQLPLLRHLWSHF